MGEGKRERKERGGEFGGLTRERGGVGEVGEEEEKVGKGNKRSGGE